MTRRVLSLTLICFRMASWMDSSSKSIRRPTYSAACVHGLWLSPRMTLLIEGHSRVSNVIRGLSQSPWTHAALYVGRLIDFEDESIQDAIRKHINVKDNTRLVIEGLLDRGTVVTPLSFYRRHHIRICRPIGITPSDTFLVINYAVK